MRLHFTPLVLCSILVLSAARPAVAQTDEQKVAADAFLTALIARSWEQVEALEHASLREKITREQWAELLDQLEGSGGRIQRHALHSAEANGGYASIVHRLYFEKDSIGVRVVVDSLNLIGGFWLDPIKKSYQFPVASYVDTTRFIEEDVTVGQDYPLPGVISIPRGEGPFPAVALVHGSGPNDKDQTIAGNKMFRDLAWGLASRGIMVLRYVKRTRQFARSMNPLTITVQEETIDDAVLALALLRDRAEADTTRLILCGHSLGASVAPEIAAHMPSVDGVIMLSPIARPLEVVIADQLRFIGSQQDTLRPSEELKLQNEIRKSEQISKGELMNSKMLMRMPASYFYDLHERDQKAYARQLNIPMLIARGSKDYQAPQMEMLLWKKWLADKPDVTFRTYENAYHILIETDATPGPWNYQQEGHVMPEVIEDLAQWCRNFSIPVRSDSE
jgi:dienelactone hydrolase